MRRKIPSTTALTAFESAARHQSFTKAADELSVTQSAVCRQIAALEDYLGIRLFRRGARGVVLTEAGASYSRQVAARLNEVERDTLDLMATGGQGGTIELAAVPTFAVKWLIPRLGEFAVRHPGITINLSARARPFLFADTAFDAAIHAGAGSWPGTEGTFLMNENPVPVCAPQLLGPAGKPRAADWSRFRLLHPSTRPYAWRQWFAAQGIEVERDMAGPRFELFSMLAAAAVQGIGIALIPEFLIEGELRSGQLLRLSDRDYVSDRAYRLIYPENKAEDPLLGAFRNWLEETARAYRDNPGRA